MTDYVSLANAVKTTFEVDSWLGNTTNVKTIETHKRGFSLADDKDAQSFGISDLPAIAITVNAQAKQQQLVTTNEIEEILPVQAITVTQHRDAQAGLDIHLAIVNNVERVLEKQKTSVDCLGIDAFVRQVTTVDDQPFKSGEYYYFVSTTTAQVELTATF